MVHALVYKDTMMAIYVSPHSQALHSLVPRSPPFFVLRFAFSILHGSRRHTEHKPKIKKQGRPGNEARPCTGCLQYNYGSITYPLAPPLLGLQGAGRGLSDICTEGGVHEARRPCHKDRLHQRD